MNQTPVPTIDLRRIAWMESTGDTTLVMPSSHATGLCQITPVCLEDYNAVHVPSMRYTMEDMLNPFHNLVVANWYFHREIPRLLSAWSLVISVPNMLVSYNWGPGNLRMWIRLGSHYHMLPAETQRYLWKYFSPEFLVPNWFKLPEPF